MANYNLFEKKELTITNLELEGTDLNLVAGAVAGTLGLDVESVLVVDVRDDHITLDVLNNQVTAEKIYGKKAELLAALAGVPGLKVAPDTDIHSQGILGQMVLDEADKERVLSGAAQMAGGILARLRQKAIVYPTGFEVIKGMIKDTNTPYIVSVLTEHGYSARAGEAIDDDLSLIAGKMRRAVEEGYGLIITTGGVGAEDKDKTVEAALKIDPTGATPYLVKFEAGKGRHVKDGIRICVAELEFACIICLPGPNDEVRLAMPEILYGMAESQGKEKLSRNIAKALRHKYTGMHHGLYN